MAKPLPRAFVACLVAVLLLCSVMVAFSVFHHAALAAQISKAQANLESARGRLRKQEAEYAQYQAELPLRLTELAELQPQADAAYEEEQRLRQQRKDMRAERNALKDELAALQEQAAASGEDNTRTAEAIIRLYEALAALESIAGLTE